MNAHQRRGNMRGLLAAGCMLILGCVARSELEPPPIESDANAMILAFVRAGADPIAFGVAVEDGHAFYPELVLQQGDAYEIYALFYACSLDAMGLVAGRIDLAHEKLLRPLRSLSSAVVVGSEQSDWAIVKSLPPSLFTAMEAGCATFSQENVALPISAVSFAMPIDEHSAIVASVDGEFFRVHSNGAVVQLDLQTSTPHLAAFRAADGEIWLLGHRGAVAHGDFDRGFEPGPPMPGASNFQSAWLSGSGTRASLELFALTDRSTFHRFDGALLRWTLLREGDYFLRAREGGLVVVRRGEAFAASGTNGTVHGLVHYARESVDIVVPPSFREDVFATTIAVVPSLGMVVGTNDSTLDVLRDGEWTSIGIASTGVFLGLVPLDDGVVFGILGPTGDGFIQEYHDAATPCPPLAIASGPIVRVEPLPGGVLTVSRTDSRSTISFVHAMRTRPECASRPE